MPTAQPNEPTGVVTAQDARTVTIHTDAAVDAKQGKEPSRETKESKSEKDVKTAEKDTNPLHRRIDMALKQLKLKRERQEDVPLLDSLKAFFGRQINRLGHFGHKNSDTQQVYFNLNTSPKLVNIDDKDIKLTKHEGVITPEGQLPMTTLTYHGDGSDPKKNEKREAEWDVLLDQIKNWASKQTGKAGLLIQGDFNVTATYYDPKLKQVVWNPTFLKMFKLFQALGLYEFTMPNALMQKPRGYQDADGDWVSCFISNQADKNGQPNDSAKPLMFYFETDEHGRLIPLVTYEEVRNRSVADMPVDQFKNTKNLKDQEPVWTNIHGILYFLWANLPTTGFKKFNPPETKFKKSALNADNSLKESTIFLNQFAMSALGNILNENLELGIPYKKATPEFTAAYTKALKAKLEEEAKNPPKHVTKTVRHKMISSIVEWVMTSDEYLASADTFLKPPIARPGNGLLVDMAAVENFADAAIKSQNFKELQRIFDAEPSGGYGFPELAGMGNDEVDLTQVTKGFEEMINIFNGKMAPVLRFGGSKEVPAMQSLVYTETESNATTPNRCITLGADETFANFQGSAADWVLQKLLKEPSPKGQESLVRFNGEIYYVATLNKGDGAARGDIRHIEKPTEKDPLETYQKLMARFDKAKGKPFSLDNGVTADKKILDMIEEEHGIRIKGSKVQSFFDKFAQALKFPAEAVKGVLKFGVTPKPAPAKRDEEVVAAAMTLD